MLLKHRALLVLALALALFHLGTPGCGTRSRSQRVIASGLSRNPALLRLRSTGPTIQPAVNRQLTCPSRSMIQPQLSFDGDPNGQAYERWREQFCRQVADVDFVPIGEGRVHRTISPAILPRLRLSASFGTPMSFVSLGTNDELVITMSPNSALSGAMGRRPLEVAAGDVTIGDPSIKGAHITQTTHGNFQTALLPRKALLRACPNAEDLIAQSIPGANPITSMFLRYYDLAHTYADKLAPAELDAVSQHLFDLSVLMIGARGDVAEQARMRGLAAARLETLKSDILAQLDNPALSLTVLSAAHRISPRTIQLMFEQAGITYSGFVLEQRLLRAERLLRNPNPARAQDHRDRAPRRLSRRLLLPSRIPPPLRTDARRRQEAFWRDGLRKLNHDLAEVTALLHQPQRVRHGIEAERTVDDRLHAIAADRGRHPLEHPTAAD
ncbi:AraC-like DNA-binding protein [Bradyrhizobium sp. i1.3.6]